MIVQQRRLLFIGFVIFLFAFVAMAGLTLSGSFNAEMSTKRGPGGPMQLGVKGSLGERSEKIEGADIDDLADASQALSMPAAKSGYAPTLVTAPYAGPTEEERALLAETRTIFAERWHEIRDQTGMDTPMPDIRLPARHLTEREKADMRAAIQAIKNER